jgi:mannose-6-phosphate isomerase-like protein (cupin superfamily)
VRWGDGDRGGGGARWYACGVSSDDVRDDAAMVKAISLTDVFGSFAEHWRPRVVAMANGQDLRVVKTRGVFPWHRHEHAEEVFLCWRGRFRVELRDRVIELGPGELCVVPRGVEHRTASDDEAEVLIVEPSDVVNTGDAPTSAFTAPRAPI